MIRNRDTAIQKGDKYRWPVAVKLSLLLAVALASLVAVGCRGATPAPADTVPSFSDTVQDRTYALGQALSLRLPFATGGNPPLSYSLEPEVPGLNFDRDTLKLEGTPTTAGSYPMTYRVVDGDDNDAESDADVLMFELIVQAPASPADTVPSFSDTVPDRTYAIGEDLSLRLPFATGGNPPLSYSLEPEVPGLNFDRDTLKLEGTPTTAGSYPMTYKVVDGDDNTAESDADVLMFELIVQAPASAEGDFVATYDVLTGGDQVFIVDMAEVPPGNFTFALDLRGVPNDVQVHLISTNTSAEFIEAPEFLTATATPDPAEPERSRSLAAPDDLMIRRDIPEITAFNNDPPVPRRGRRSQQRTVTAPPAANSVGDTQVFKDYDWWLEAVVDIPATARAVVSGPGLPMGFTLWVADESWGAGCGQANCVTQPMVDEVATAFLQEGDGNDVYDWVTAIFGDPWGPHAFPDMIDPATDEIHILLFDIHADNSTWGGVVGYFWAEDLYLTNVSNQKLMFYLDSVLLATPDDDEPWARSHYWPTLMIETLAHEFQHLIHFYQKLVKHDFEPVSETWLNEMASEVAEDLVASKLQGPGPRGVAHDDGTAGEPLNRRGRLPLYNLWNDIQVTTWYSALENYSINYALGAYLARTYGAELFTAIVQNDESGTAAIEAALEGGRNFGRVLANWAVANVLSDNPHAPAPYRYNTGDWTTTRAGGLMFDLGSINLYNYYMSSARLEGPYFHSVAQLNRRSEQRPHSNIYVDAGSHRGLLEGTIEYASGTQLTIVVKE